MTFSCHPNSSSSSSSSSKSISHCISFFWSSSSSWDSKGTESCDDAFSSEDPKGIAECTSVSETMISVFNVVWLASNREALLRCGSGEANLIHSHVIKALGSMRITQFSIDLYYSVRATYARDAVSFKNSKISSQTDADSWEKKYWFVYLFFLSIFI